MRTPKSLRGHFYPGEHSVGCSTWEMCPATTRCRNFNPHRNKCIVCETDCGISIDDSYEDQDMKLIMTHLNKQDIHVQVSQYLEYKTGKTVMGNDRRTIQGNVEVEENLPEVKFE